MSPNSRSDQRWDYGTYTLVYLNASLERDHDMFTLSNLERALRNPELFLEGITLGVNRCHRTLNRWLLDTPVSVMDEDWDNLILLDACRYDAFSEVCSMEGTLESRVSKGSTSKEFTKKNFADRELHDTVIITANPYIGLVEEGTFHAVITLLDEWEADVQTVEPATVVESAKGAQGIYSDKRLIVHFMQPHQPYLGDTAAEIRSEIEDRTADHVGWNNQPRESVDHDVETLDGTNQLEAPTHPDLTVTRATVWEAYLETLGIVLEHVRELVEFLDGKTVISADHGELLGEKPYLLSDPVYGHPGSEWTRTLREVPWFVIPSVTRRTVTSDPPGRHDTVDDSELDRKLEALGYR